MSGTRYAVVVKVETSEGGAWGFALGQQFTTRLDAELFADSVRHGDQDAWVDAYAPVCWTRVLGATVKAVLA